MTTRSQTSGRRLIDAIDAVLAWRARRIGVLASAEQLAREMSVERLPYTAIPQDLSSGVFKFRKLRQDARVRRARRFLERFTLRPWKCQACQHISTALLLTPTGEQSVPCPMCMKVHVISVADVDLVSIPMTPATLSPEAMINVYAPVPRGSA